jgi:hypothetical protein
MTMRLWTYKRPFQYDGNALEVRYSISLTIYTSQLFFNGTLVDECTHLFNGDFKVVEHTYQADNQSSNNAKALVVSVGYYSWLNVGIEVKCGDEFIYQSHPGKDIHFANDKLENLAANGTSAEFEEKRKLQSDRWQKKQGVYFCRHRCWRHFFHCSKGDWRSKNSSIYWGVFRVIPCSRPAFR